MLFNKRFANIFCSLEEELHEINEVFNLDLPKLKENMESLNLMKNIIRDLKDRKNDHLKIMNLIFTRRNLILRIESFENKIKFDKNRFKGNSIQLLNEEKFRKKSILELLNLEKEILEKLKFYKDKWDEGFYYTMEKQKVDNEDEIMPYEEIIKAEIEERSLRGSFYSKRTRKNE